jgi:hypothetical protein
MPRPFNMEKMIFSINGTGEIYLQKNIVGSLSKARYKN